MSNNSGPSAAQVAQEMWRKTQIQRLKALSPAKYDHYQNIRQKERLFILACVFGIGGMALLILISSEGESLILCMFLVFIAIALIGVFGNAASDEFLERIEGGGNFPIEQAVDAVLKRHRGRGIVVLLSDFLTLGDLHKPLNLLFKSGLEIFALQILSPIELYPEVTGDLRFVDSETGDTLDISSAGELLGIYHEHRDALSEELSLMCRQRAGRFLSINSADSLEDTLFDSLLRKGWVV